MTRTVAAVALGVGLAGFPVAVVLGLVGQTVRGAGFAREVALGNELHPWRCSRSSSRGSSAP